jgi:ribonuclease P protein component
VRFTRSLRENRDFRRLYARGRTTAGGLLAVYVRPNRTGGSRLGLTVSGKLGGAVVRNRIRRRLKEAYRLREASLLPGFDLVVVARSRAVAATYWDLDRELGRLLARVGVARPGP